MNGKARKAMLNGSGLPISAASQTLALAQKTVPPQVSV
jgi:hypothetical protein